MHSSSSVILLDNHGCFTYVEHNLLKRVTLALEDLGVQVELSSLAHIINAAMTNFFEPSVQRIRSVEAEYNAWQHVWKYILKEYTLPLSEEHLNRMEKCHYTYAMKLYPDALPAMEKLCQIKRISMVANALPSLFSILHDWPASQYFERIFVSCLLGVEKPGFTFFETVCNALSVQKEQCILIDDTYENVASAKRYGIRPIHLDRSSQSAMNDDGIWVCPSLIEAISVVTAED